jgi:fumarate reductase subunit D
MFLPVLLFFTGIAIPLSWSETSYEGMASLVEPWYSRLFILALVSLSLFHWAHRFRFTLHEGLQLHPYDKPIALFCYGGAFFGTGLAAVVLFM